MNDIKNPSRPPIYDKTSESFNIERLYISLLDVFRHIIFPKLLFLEVAKALLIPKDSTIYPV